MDVLGAGCESIRLRLQQTDLKSRSAATINSFIDRWFEARDDSRRRSVHAGHERLFAAKPFLVPPRELRRTPVLSQSGGGLELIETIADGGKPWRGDVEIRPLA